MDGDLKKIKVLLGFSLQSADSDKKFEEKLQKQLRLYGYEATFARRTKKKDIILYLENNHSCTHAVLTELVGEMGAWNENELADLVDERQINLVIALTTQRARQVEFMTTLYAAGITSAVFEKGRDGIPAEEVAELLIMPRSRKQAREYYGINTQNISIRSLTYEMYNNLLGSVLDESLGDTQMARFLAVAEKMNPYQLGDFINKLPKALKAEISQYAEFAQLIEQLKESGVKVAYRKPHIYKSMDDELGFEENARQNLNKKGMGDLWPDNQTIKRRHKRFAKGIRGYLSKDNEGDQEEYNSEGENWVRAKGIRGTAKKYGKYADDEFVDEGGNRNQMISEFFI